MRSLASESERTYIAGPPLELFAEARSNPASSNSGFLDLEKEMNARENFGEGIGQDTAHQSSSFPSRLDWFAVDLKDELSALDPGVATAHVASVVEAINQVRSLEYMSGPQS